MDYLIIGNGIAGVQAAETIRGIDPVGNITIISAEKFPPYCRPMISLVLEGVLPESRLKIRQSDYHDRLKIKSILGEEVTAMDIQHRTVTCKNGSNYPYDKLLIASGANPRPIKADGQALKNIFFMRTQAHVSEMVSSLAGVKHALVLGGGLVGFKAAYGLLRRGIHVTLLISSDHPLTMQVDETAGKMIRRELEARGLNVRTGVEVRSFDGDHRVRKAYLSDGSSLPCDLCVIGKGVLPAKGFIPSDDIKIDLGVMVDQHMETSAKDVFAAGDIAETMDIARKTPWVNAIWPEAVNQGRTAGMNMAGRPVAYRGSLGRNVIRIFNMDLLTAGLFNVDDENGYEIVSRSDPYHGIYRKFIFRDNLLMGFILLNRIDHGGILASIVQRQLPLKVEKEKLLDVSFNFSSLLF